MGSAGLALQKAIYDRLTGNAALMAIVSGVFDSVPEAQAFPYITIGDDTAVDFGTHTWKGQNLTITIHSWSMARGRAQVKDIMKRVYDLLHEQLLTMQGHTMFSMRFDFEQTFLDPDGVTYHGLQRFRALTAS
jgi:hypothetical protein